MCLIIFEEKAEIQDRYVPFEPEPGSGSFAEILGHYKRLGKDRINSSNLKYS